MSKNDNFCPFYQAKCPEHNGCTFWNEECLIKRIGIEAQKISKLFNNRSRNFEDYPIVRNSLSLRSFRITFSSGLENQLLNY